MKKINRKEFLKKISIVTLGFVSFSKLVASKSLLNKIIPNTKLIKDPKGIIDLYEGFSYKVISNYKDFTSLFNIQVDVANNIIIRNYLLWIVGEKVYYLEHQETNSTPDEPVIIPDKINFNEFVLDIWKKQLPDIYAENYLMREPGKGEDLLKEVTFS